MILQKEFIQQVKQKTDIVKLVSKYTVLEKAGDGIYSGRCPHPDHNDSTPSFRVFEKDQSWCCYGCHHGNKESSKKTKDGNNYGSDCIAFIQWISKGEMSWADSVLYLAKEAGLEVPNSPYAKIYKRNKETALKYYYGHTEESKNYLYSRGLDDEDIKQYVIGFDGIKIHFPLLDRNQQVLGFTSRWLNLPPNCKDKYRNSKASEVFNKSTYFYGIHLIDSNYPYVFITEGTFDHILPTKYGLPNVLGSLGTSFTDEHAEIIYNLGLEPVFIMDGDEAGLNAAKKSIEKMHQLGVHSRILPLHEDIDLADLALIYKGNLLKYIEENMMTYGYYLTNGLVQDYVKNLLALKDKMRPKIQEAIQSAPKDERQNLIDLVYEVTNISLKGE